ncbi:MAG TPA: GAF domain-containing sensor histidine kinase [Longimicrobiaceae bacterium]|nr:GAF domain-containing sensor histidine kinase [Longimicrobiaceae bacterium]
MDRTEQLSQAAPEGTSLSELRAAHEIAHAFLTSDSPGGVYRLALERVCALVGAAFGCVYLREGEGDTLRLAAAFNWPAGWSAYLDSMRVRIGAGPTGQAVAENRVVEVFDVFGDPELADWWEAARELGFAASISLPLGTGDAPAGAITFYFDQPETLRESDRSLLRLVADQLAATAEKAHLIDDLRRANSLLREQNVELEARFREAEEARRLKGEFLANVSHELRTPLTAILGFTYLLREGLSGELHAEQRGAVEKIETAGSELMTLIDDLLDFTTVKMGRVVLAPERCDAVALARAAMSTLKPPDTVALGSDVPDDEVPVHADPSQVVRILRGLVSNAYKFTAVGRVTVRVRSAAISGPGWSRAADGAACPVVMWDVEDTGIGIEPADHERIFDEFRQVDGSATRRYGGTGMGLALARQLARCMHGDIFVRSTPGQGSTFTLALPVGTPSADQSEDARPAAPRAETPALSAGAAAAQADSDAG